MEINKKIENDFSGHVYNLFWLYIDHNILEKLLDQTMHDFEVFL